MLVIVAAATCLALGWWQWTRFESVGGTGQNLGYAFQWPLFAVFFVYAYRRFVQLEDEDADTTTDTAERAEPREIPADLLPTRPKPAQADDPNDPEARQTLEYNEYLAELAARESDRSGK